MFSKIIPSKLLTKLLLFFCVITGIALMHGGARAATVDELQKQKDQLQIKLNQLNQQIKTYQGQITSTQKQQASLKNEIFIYDTQIKTTELQIQAKETQITDSNLQITELQNQIDRRVLEIEENKKILTGLIVQLNELDTNSIIHMTLGNKNFSEFLDQLQYTTNVQDKVYQIVQNIKSVKAKLETQQSDLRIQLKKLEELRDQLNVTQDSLESQRRQKEGLLTQTKGIEKNYQKLLTASKNEEANLEKEAKDLDDQVRAKLGQRKISPNGKALAKPMDGVLTQGYGNTGFTALGYSFHNGVDWAGPAGTPIYAAADGTVTACDTGEASYGNWCAVKHTIASKDGDRCIITLYAHMRSFTARAGKKLAQGDLIGYEGNTGNTTRLIYGNGRGFHLHFTVFDCDGFGISKGKYTNIYGPYTVPYGYTYNPLDFL